MLRCLLWTCLFGSFLFILPDAAFAFNLKVSINGQGTLSGAPGDISCNPDGQPICHNHFHQQYWVGLTPVALPGWRFAGWKGEGCRGREDCFVHMNRNRRVKAFFKPIPPPLFNLKIVASDSKTKQGEVFIEQRTGKAADCQTVCISSYTFNSQATLKAKPRYGYFFAGWQGCDQSRDRITWEHDCQATIFGRRTIRALFNPKPRRELDLSVQGKGVVFWDGSIPDCASKCKTTAIQGEKRELFAQAEPGWKFQHWLGDCSRQQKCKVDLQRDSQVGAVFIPDHYRVNIFSSSGGVVKVAPFRKACSSYCQISSARNKQVILVAIPRPGYQFLCWQGKLCSNRRPIFNVVINKDSKYVALFQRAQESLIEPWGKYFWLLSKI